MANNTFTCVLLICVTLLGGISAKPVQYESYVDGLNIQYENGKWICGDVDCPEEANGCKIFYKTDDNNHKILRQAFTCFDQNKTDLLSGADIVELPKERSININIESYKDAVSAYSTGFDSDGHESAEGVIALKDWNEFKEDSKRCRE